ncbi:MAG TPA: hypothetical protein VFO79_15570 [Xanthomonadales bacterium]|nr:hypothetical protein [Xanthomonadales bacterium]
MRYLAAVLVLSSCMLHDPDPPPDHDKTPPTGDDPPSYPEDPPPGGRRVFVTRGTYTGALSTVMGIADGLAAGDAICQQRAKAAGMTGTWVAWLSSSSKDAIDRITAQGPWRLVGGDTAFENRAQLYGEPLVRLERDERGELLSTAIDAMAWTGTRAGGGRHAYTCGDWTASDGTGIYGHRAVTFDWTESYWTTCRNQLHLICFEN